VKFDAIAAVESCYAYADDDHAWLAGILDALAPLDRGPGIYAHTFRWLPNGSWTLGRCATRGAFEQASLPEVASRNQTMPADILHRIYAPGVGYALRRAPELRQIGGDLFRKAGMDDALGIIATEPDGRSVIVSVPVPANRPRLVPRTTQQITCLSAHVGSGLRLRQAVAVGEGSTAKVDAVLDPEGRMLEATGDAKQRAARESLADAVKRLERARGRLRRTDPDEALRLWEGLVSGRWSLVDRCESDGKRYLLARRNEPSVRDPAALTSRERSVLAFAAMGHQNKYIAYLLGLHGSTVSMCLDAAQRKLKIDSRSELIRLFAPLVSNRANK
jgi:DNA-binding CsgD family transcriptional regulator